MTVSDDPQPTHDAAGAPGTHREELRHEADALKHDLRRIGETVRDAARQKVEEFRGQAGDKYEAYRSQAGGAYEQYAAQGKQSLDQLEHYVREQPVKSLLIAAGVGMALGILYKRS